MKPKTKAQLWPELHWNVAILAACCIPVLAQILVYYEILTPARAISSSVISIVFVFVLTWLHTRADDKKLPE